MGSIVRITKAQISEFEDRSIGFTQSEQKRNMTEKKLTKTQRSMGQ